MKTIIQSRTISLILSITAAGMLSLIQCTTIGGTESGNARIWITGTLYEPDGTTPAVGVAVVIRPRNSIADTADAVQSLMKAISKDTIITDDAGQFTFNSIIDDGVYCIEALSEKNAVLFDSVIVGKTSPTVKLAPRTLKPSGAIKGVIEFSGGDTLRKVLILVFGIDRLVRVGEDGHFAIENLAEGTYDVRILPGTERYLLMDTMGIPVFSTDTTDLGSLYLQSNILPAVKNISVSYDTAVRIVTVAWSKADTSAAKGYNVYRRNSDSDTLAVRINRSPIQDTCWFDSAVHHTSTYEYHVVTIDINDNEGRFGEGTTVTLTGGYECKKTIETGIHSSEFTYQRGTIYLCDQSGRKIQMIDTAGNQVGSFGDTGLQALINPQTITSRNDTIYIADYISNSSGYSIKCYALDGMLLKTIIFNDFYLLQFAVVSGNELYALGVDGEGKGYLSILNSNGTVMQSLILKDSYAGCIIPRDSMIGLTYTNYYFSDTTTIEWFNRNLELTDSTVIRGYSGGFMTVDENGYVYSHSNRGISIFDREGIFSARFDSEEYGTIQVSSDGLLFIGNERSIFIYGFPDK